MTHPLTPREKVFVSVSCEGEYCHCGSAAVRKVGEEIMHDDPRPRRHNLTAYVCARHFAEMMGPAGARSVGYTALASGSGDHAELTRLADDATPGPWEATGTTVWREEAVPIPVTVCCGNGLPSGECCGNGVEDCEWDRTQGEIANAGSNDAAFIAAANPATVLAILAENAALRESISGHDRQVSGMLRARLSAENRATEAERKLAEAVGLLRKFHDAWRSGCGWLPSMNALDDEITAFLSKEAERG